MNKSQPEDTQPLLSMSKATEDPFYKIRDEVRSQTDAVKIRHEKFQDLVRNCDTSNSTEFKDLRKGLVKEVRMVDKKLKVLREAVEMVDKNRQKFAHIKDAELASRKRFVDETQEVLNEVKSGMESPFVRRKMEDDENKSRRDNFDSNTANLNNGPSSIEKENDRFIKDQRQQTKQMIQQQDEHLDVLGSAVDRLGKIGADVNQELKEQNQMLTGLETDMDDAGNKMETVMGQLNKLLKSKDGCQIWTIVILALILIILIALLIWT